jgi:hypothetical protein
MATKKAKKGKKTAAKKLNKKLLRNVTTLKKSEIFPPDPC